MGDIRIGALILAAGQSKRMRAVKPLLALGEQCVIERVIENYQRLGIKEIVVVLGYHAERIRPVVERMGAMAVVNLNPEEGMFSSIQKGCSVLKQSTEGFFMQPADIPLVRHETLRAMEDCFRHNPAHVIYPTISDQRGHPIMVPKSCYPVIERQDRQFSMRDLLAHYEHQQIELPCADEGILWDMDTPEAYEAVSKLALRREVPTVMECEMVWTLLNTPDSITAHCRKVSQVACKIGDLFNHRTEERVSLDCLESAGLLHDICKGLPNHGAEAGKLLKYLGFDGIVKPVTYHMDLPMQEWSGRFTEVEILYLADKMTQETDLIRLEHRFSNMAKILPEGDQKKFQHRAESGLLLLKALEAQLKIADLFHWIT